MTVLLYRPSLDFTSGAGQLMRTQLRALVNAGERAEIGCERGALKFWLRSGTRARRVSRTAALVHRDGRIVVDHGLCLPTADVVFVHNLATEAARHGVGSATPAQVAAEAAFFRELGSNAVVVANSGLVKNALVDHFAIAPARIVVHYPGFDSRRFDSTRAAAVRAMARRKLGVSDGAPLVGLITSGDFQKRGLDVFVQSAESISAVRPDVRFLVVGSKALPASARAHELYRTGKMLYRPKGREPERWFAALDLFSYPARFEEFGMVVVEAQASGLPIVTSRVVGAAECLAPIYDRWLGERPDAAQFAVRSLALLADRDLRRELSQAGIQRSRAYDDHVYGSASVATIRGVKSGGSSTRRDP
jgi:glycosyltransferase involved in cell wall biosynthesis